MNKNRSNSFQNKQSSRQNTTQTSPKHHRLKQLALEAIPALRIRDVDYLKNNMESMLIEIEKEGAAAEDDHRFLVQFRADIFDALSEDMCNSNETTLVYRAMQPLVGMVFGKHGLAASQLQHELGATLELATKDQFHIRCPRSRAREVQRVFEEKLSNILVRLNTDNVTVVMRPEKMMVMLSPMTLTPVLVLGMLSPNLILMRIHDNQMDDLFQQVYHDMQDFYGNLKGSRFSDLRLSLPITQGTLACYKDENCGTYLRVVIEELEEADSPAGYGGGTVTWARIWKLDFGGYEWVTVDCLYRLRACYLQVPRQCFVSRLLYAHKLPSCPLTVHQIFMQYFHGHRFFAISLFEKPSNLSHVLCLRDVVDSCHINVDVAPQLNELHDILSYLVQDGLYEVQSYDSDDVSKDMDYLVKSVKTSIPYPKLCRDRLSDATKNQNINNNLNHEKVSSKAPSDDCSIRTAESALQELLEPYQKQPHRRYIWKYHGCYLNEGERNLLGLRKLPFVKDTIKIDSELQSSALHTSTVYPETAILTENQSFTTFSYSDPFAVSSQLMLYTMAANYHQAFPLLPVAEPFPMLMQTEPCASPNLPQSGVTVLPFPAIPSPTYFVPSTIPCHLNFQFASTVSVPTSPFPLSPELSECNWPSIGPSSPLQTFPTFICDAAQYFPLALSQEY